MKDEDSKGRKKERRAAMRRWLRHQHGVRRISCESGNTSQLTVGWAAWRGGEGVAAPRLCDNQYSAPPPPPLLRARRALGPFLSDLSLACRFASLYRVPVPPIHFTRLRAKSLISHAFECRNECNEIKAREGEKERERECRMRCTFHVYFWNQRAFRFCQKICQRFHLIWTIRFRNV